MTRSSEFLNINAIVLAFDILYTILIVRVANYRYYCFALASCNTIN
jgi:hypothetical protein